MNKFMIFINVLVIVSLMLISCGGEVSGGIQLPGGEEQAAAPDNTLIYVLLGAIVLVAVVTLVARK